MAYFVALDPRTASQPMARPAATVTPAIAARPAAMTSRRGAAGTPFAPNEPFRATERAPIPPKAAREQTAETRSTRSSDPFTAQRLAEEAGPDPKSRLRLSTADAAYIKTRDSQIQILPSIQALDLRV